MSAQVFMEMGLLQRVLSRAKYFSDYNVLFRFVSFLLLFSHLVDFSSILSFIK